MLSAAEQQRCIKYLESCYLFRAFMPPESYYRCQLGCDPRKAPEDWDQPLTDGTWWFAGSALHYLQVHDYALPERVLQHLRRSQFVVPDLHDGKPFAQGSGETRRDAES